MFFWIYDIPIWNLALGFTALFVGVTWFGILFISPILRLWFGGQEGLNDLVGYTLSAFGVFYGLLLGLLAVSTYQNSSDLEGIVASEAAALASLWRDVSNYPEPASTQMHDQLRTYTRFLIDEAWPAQRAGKMAPRGVQLMTEFQRDLCRFKPADVSEQILHAETMSAFNKMIEFRSKRIQNIGSGIPGVMWYVVGVGAIINTLLILFFRMRLDLHFILGGILAFFVGMLIFLVAAMDYPFRGELSIGPDRFQVVYDALMKPAGGAPAPDAAK
jgi:hypothetical protein